MKNLAWTHFSTLSLAALVVAAASLAVNAERLRPTDGTIAQSDYAAARPASIRHGDRLKVTFLELVDGDAATPKSSRAAAPRVAAPTYFQRMDLSGEFSLDADGALVIPRLGRVQAIGRDPSTLQAELAAAFRTAIGQKADVTVSIVERAPVFVSGQVRTPGSFKYQPGMLVLQAVTLAGGVDLGMSSGAQLIEAAREVERLQSAAEAVKRLTARRARLEAERLGHDTITPSTQFAAASEKGADLFLRLEQDVLDLEIRKRRIQFEEVEASLQSNRAEIASHAGRLRHIDKQIALMTERTKNLDNLHANGHITRHQLITGRGELADAEMRKLDVQLAITNAETRRVALEQSKGRLEMDAMANIVRQIATNEEELAQARRAMTTSEILTDLLDNAQTASERSAGIATAYEIVRTTSTGAVTLAAKETTPLLPGDIVRIVARAQPQPSKQAVPTRRAAMSNSATNLR